MWDRNDAGSAQWPFFWVLLINGTQRKFFVTDVLNALVISSGVLWCGGTTLSNKLPNPPYFYHAKALK